jgi:hypothetical protein
MIEHLRQIITMIAAWSAFTATVSLAAPVEFTMDFPGGFNVSINGGPLSPSGPIIVRGIVDNTTPDIDGSPTKGEFPLSSVTFTGAGFTNQAVNTPLSLLTSSKTEFAFQLRGQYNEGILGWQDFNTSSPYIANVNSLSTLLGLPYSRVGNKTYWYQGLGGNAWNLGGNTIGANLGGNGPAGHFTISVPEPSAGHILVYGLGGCAFRRRKSVVPNRV